MGKLGNLRINWKGRNLKVWSWKGVLKKVGLLIGSISMSGYTSSTFDALSMWYTW